MTAEIQTGLSFDDVLLIPQHSDVLLSEIDLQANLTDQIKLSIPVISAAMDTVSEADLAIALAREGGMGVIHRNCKIEEQARMVSRVKRSENTVIEHPITVRADMKICDTIKLMRERNVTGMPVVNEQKKLEGIVTRRDICFIENDTQLHVKDVMTPRSRLVTGKPGFSLEDAKEVLYKHRIEKLPLVDEEDHLVGLMTSADIEKRLMFESASKDQDGHLRVGAAIGVGNDYFARARELVAAGCDALFIDAATGHTSTVISVLEKLNSSFDIPVIAGNVVTAAGAADLIAAGSAAIKVGVGPGSICTTRIIAGVGMPQFTAIRNVATTCREKGVPLIADGGLRYSGDLLKALAAGANCVMLGSLLAGTEESPGNKVRWQGRAFKEYRGMGSMSAMRKGAGDRYGQSATGKLVPEGVEARVPFKGSLSSTIFQLMGGVRSGMGYVGAHNLTELYEKAKFVRITTGGLKESHPHDITITEEPINYSAM